MCLLIDETELVKEITSRLDGGQLDSYEVDTQCLSSHVARLVHSRANDVVYQENLDRISSDSITRNADLFHRVTFDGTTLLDELLRSRSYTQQAIFNQQCIPDMWRFLGHSFDGEAWSANPDRADHFGAISLFDHSLVEALQPVAQLRANASQRARREASQVKERARGPACRRCGRPTSNLHSCGHCHWCCYCR